MDTTNLLIQICKFIEEVMGPNAEVVLHSAETGSILWITENNESQRKIGDIEYLSVLELLNKSCENKGTNRIIGKINTSQENKVIRSSNLMIRDENKKLQYIICVNQDITGYAKLQDSFKYIFQMESVTTNTTELDIEEVTTNIILEELKHSDAYVLDTKDAKIKVVKRLENRGVFKVKQAIPQVCKVLKIPQPTLYKYLKEIQANK